MWGVVATDILFGIELEMTARWPCSPPSRQGKLEHVKVRRCVYIARVASDESQIAMVNDVKVSTVVVAITHYIYVGPAACGTIECPLIPHIAWAR